MLCMECGSAFKAKTIKKRYCNYCADKKTKEVKTRSYKKRAPERREIINATSSRRQKRKRLKCVEKGKEISKVNRLSFGDVFVDLEWSIGIKYPFSHCISKNSIFGRNGNKVYTRDESRIARSQIALLINNAVKKAGVEIVQNKLWVSIFVEKQNMRSDAVNVVDLVCDAIKDGIPLDDRWYSIKRLDWSVVKVDPQIYIQIGQETKEHAQVCSHCGRIQPFSAYKQNKSAKNGIGRECIDCRSLK